MTPTLAVGALLVAGLIAGCSSDGSARPRSQPTPAPTVAALPSTAPSAAPSMSAETFAACTHVGRAFAAQASRDWKTVLHELDTAWRLGHRAADRQLAYLLPEPGALDLEDTQTLGEQTDTLTFACGLPGRPIPGSSPAAPSRRRVPLSVTAVDGVPMGTPADEAERRLRASLGDADSDELPGCDGETGRRLSWGVFSVVLSNGGNGAVVLRGWTLRHGVSRVTYALPYDVQPGDAMRDALTRVPAAVRVDGEGSTAERTVIHTDQSPDLLWISDPAGNGDVETISFRDPSCD
jgi:hypothetical protein